MAEVRRPAPGSSFELYARAMLDHWLGKKVVVEMERDDGFRRASAIGTYFAPASKWSRLERDAMRLVRGRVLDLGCGPGRHALYLQKTGHEVVGLDASPTQVAPRSRLRGSVASRTSIPGRSSDCPKVSVRSARSS
jgi:SAM-dependent methyltransferase